MSCPNRDGCGESPLPWVHHDEGGRGGGGGLELEQRQKQHLLPLTENTESIVIPPDDHDLARVDLHQYTSAATGVVAAETSFDSDEENNGLPSKHSTTSNDLLLPPPPPLHTSQPTSLATNVSPSSTAFLGSTQGIQRTAKDLFGRRSEPPPLASAESCAYDEDQLLLSDVCLDETVHPWVPSVSSSQGDGASTQVISTPSTSAFRFSFEQGQQHAPASRIVSPDNRGSFHTATPLVVANGASRLVAQHTASTLSRHNYRHQQPSHRVEPDQHYAPTLGFEPSVTVPLAQQGGLRRRRMDAEAAAILDAPFRLANVPGQESVGTVFTSSSTTHPSGITPSIVINSYSNSLPTFSFDGRPLTTSVSVVQEQTTDDRSLVTPLSGPPNHDSGHHHTPPTEVELEGVARAPRPLRRWEWIEGCLKIMFVVVSRIVDVLWMGENICWVLMAGFSLVSTSTSCNVPLKSFFWLVTLQKLLTVGTIELFNRWSDNPASRAVFPLIAFNVIVLAYKCWVLRFGLHIVMTRHDGNCPLVTPAFFHTTMAFVCLSLARWCSVFLGVAIPICFLPSQNGKRATIDVQIVHLTIAITRPGAPPGCIDHMQVIAWNDLLESHPKECCICMGSFAAEDDIVTTTCHHVFHKSCCQDWLCRARTCPVCRTDIPGSLGIHHVEESYDDDSTLDREASELLSRNPTDARDQTNEFPRVSRALRQLEERIRILQRQLNRSNDSDQPTSTEGVPAATGNGNEGGDQGNVNFILIWGPQLIARAPSAMRRDSSGNDESNNNDGTTTGTLPLANGNLADRLNNLSDRERSDVSFRLLLCALSQRRDRLRQLLQQDRTSGVALPGSVVVLRVCDDNRGRLQFVALGATNPLTSHPGALGAAPPLTTRPSQATSSANVQFSRFFGAFEMSEPTSRNLSGRISQQGSFHRESRLSTRPVNRSRQRGNRRWLHHHRSSRRRGTRTSAAASNVRSESHTDDNRVVAFPSLVLGTEPLDDNRVVAFASLVRVTDPLGLSPGVALSNNDELSSMEEGRGDDQSVLA